MAEFIFKNRQVQFPNRIKLTPVSGQANVYEVERQEGIIIEQGTPLNADTFLEALKLDQKTITPYRISGNRLNLAAYAYFSRFDTTPDAPVIIIKNRGQWSTAIGPQNEVDTLHFGAVNNSSIQNGNPAWNKTVDQKWKFHGEVFVTKRLKVDAANTEISAKGIRIGGVRPFVYGENYLEYYDVAIDFFDGTRYGAFIGYIQLANSASTYFELVSATKSYRVNGDRNQKLSAYVVEEDSGTVVYVSDGNRNRADRYQFEKNAKISMQAPGASQAGGGGYLGVFTPLK